MEWRKVREVEGRVRMRREGRSWTDGDRREDGVVRESRTVLGIPVNNALVVPLLVLWSPNWLD